jgi:hypothetical protein
MADFFSNLAGQVLGAAPEVWPLLPPRFASWPSIPLADVVPRPQALIDPTGPDADAPLPTFRQMSEFRPASGPAVQPDQTPAAQDRPETAAFEPAGLGQDVATPGCLAVDDTLSHAPPAASLLGPASPPPGDEPPRPPVIQAQAVPPPPGPTAESTLQPAPRPTAGQERSAASARLLDPTDNTGRLLRARRAEPVEAEPVKTQPELVEAHAEPVRVVTRSPSRRNGATEAISAPPERDGVAVFNPTKASATSSKPVITSRPPFGGEAPPRVLAVAISDVDQGGDCFVARKGRSLLAMTGSWILSGGIHHGVARNDVSDVTSGDRPSWTAHDDTGQDVKRLGGNRAEPVEAQPKPVGWQPEPAETRRAELPAQLPARAPASAPPAVQPAAPVPAPVVQRQAAPAMGVVASLAPQPVPASRPELPISTQARATSTATASEWTATALAPPLPGDRAVAGWREPTIVPAPEPAPGELGSMARAEAARPAAAQREPLPMVRVTIGRVVVRASPADERPPARRVELPRPPVSLEEYLRGRQGGAR